MQHGLKCSSALDGLCCWSSWYDSSGWVGEAKGFLWWGVTPAVMVGCSGRRSALARS